MKIAICDNEEACRDQVQRIVQAYANTHTAADISLAVFERSDDLLDSARKAGGYDIYILDILMPGMTGIELGLQLRRLGLGGKILYLTSSQEYAIQAFHARASLYLLKPVDETELTSAIHELVCAIGSAPRQSLLVKTRDATIRLSADNILYAELSRRSILYHLAGGKVVESTTIRSGFSEAVQPLLQDKRFLLCGTSILVNLQYITLVDTESIVFQDRQRLFLSKKLCRELRSVWYDFWFDKEELQ